MNFQITPYCENEIDDENLPRHQKYFVGRDMWYMRTSLKYISQIDYQQNEHIFLSFKGFATSWEWTRPSA